MEQQRLCNDCYLLVRSQLINNHDNLVELSHIHNDTLYECNSCHHLVRLSHVPHVWSIIGAAELFDEQAIKSA